MCLKSFFSLPDYIYQLQPTKAFLFFPATGKNSSAAECIDRDDNTECGLEDGILVIDFPANVTVHAIKIFDQESSHTVFDGAGQEHSKQASSIVIFDGVHQELLKSLISSRVLQFDKTEGYKFFNKYITPVRKWVHLDIHPSQGQDYKNIVKLV